MQCPKKLFDPAGTSTPTSSLPRTCAPRRDHRTSSTAAASASRSDCSEAEGPAATSVGPTDAAPRVQRIRRAEQGAQVFLSIRRPVRSAGLHDRRRKQRAQVRIAIQSNRSRAGNDVPNANISAAASVSRNRMPIPSNTACSAPRGSDGRANAIGTAAAKLTAHMAAAAANIARNPSVPASLFVGNIPKADAIVTAAAEISASFAHRAAGPVVRCSAWLWLTHSPSRLRGGRARGASPRPTRGWRSAPGG